MIWAWLDWLGIRITRLGLRIVDYAGQGDMSICEGCGALIRRREGEFIRSSNRYEARRCCRTCAA